MSSSLIIMDIGDVLVTTVPMAHYRLLARRVAAPWQQVQDAVEGTGVVAGFESGSVAVPEFIQAVRDALAAPELREHEVLDAWAAVIGPLDPLTTKAAACAARAGRLLLASNTNPFHWPLVRARLRLADIDTPACLSFQVGHAKPADGFFASLELLAPSLPRSAVFIDDRAENVAAAMSHGLAGWQHADSARTAAYVMGLLP
jgi:glucose-1-phosphatase